MTEHPHSPRPAHIVLRAAAIAALAGAMLLPSRAYAWVSFGIAVPPVVVAPAPYPYYAPGYYPPPPGYYAPPPPGTYARPPPPQQSPAPELSQNQPQYGATCYAGNYTCAAYPYAQVNSVCSCPGLGAPSFGTVQ